MTRARRAPGVNLMITLKMTMMLMMTMIMMSQMKATTMMMVPITMMMERLSQRVYLKGVMKKFMNIVTITILMTNIIMISILITIIIMISIMMIIIIMIIILMTMMKVGMMHIMAKRLFCRRSFNLNVLIYFYTI